MLIFFHSYDKQPEGLHQLSHESYTPIPFQEIVVDYAWNPVASGLLYKMINPEQVVQTAIAIKE